MRVQTEVRRVWGVKLARWGGPCFFPTFPALLSSNIPGLDCDVLVPLFLLCGSCLNCTCVSGSPGSPAWEKVRCGDALPTMPCCTAAPLFRQHAFIAPRWYTPRISMGRGGRIVATCVGTGSCGMQRVVGMIAVNTNQIASPRTAQSATRLDWRRSASVHCDLEHIQRKGPPRRAQSQVFTLLAVLL